MRNIFEFQNEWFVDQKCFKPVKAPPYLYNMKKIALNIYIKAKILFIYLLMLYSTKQKICWSEML